MKKHKLIEMIEEEVEDGKKIYIEYDDCMFTKEIRISHVKNQNGENVTVLSPYEYVKDSEVFTDE